MGAGGLPSPAATDGAALPKRVPAPQERGWGSLLTALATFLLVPATPLLRTLVPIEQTWILLLPALAVCTLVGWRAGGRLTLAGVWTALAVWVLTHPLAGADGGDAAAYDRLARGWAFLLAGAFGAVFVLGSRRRFFSVALSAVALSLAAVLALALPSGRGERLHGALSRELAAREAADVARWDSLRATPENRQYLAEHPDKRQRLEEVTRVYRGLPRRLSVLAPAVLALESLAALALAWALFHRMSRVRIGPPLGSLKQFRFNDQLVWGVIVGVILLVVPPLDQLRGVALNLILFFGTLYALRGAGVLSYFLSPGLLTAIALTLLAPLLWPIYAVGAFGLGLGDTWLDWRRPRSPTA